MHKTRVRDAGTEAIDNYAVKNAFHSTVNLHYFCHSFCVLIYIRIAIHAY